MENSERDGNTRPPELPLEKPICKVYHAKCQAGRSIVGIKFAGRNINNLRYADTPPLWQKVKRKERVS